MYKAIANQFRRPSGFFGKMVSRIMVKGNSPAYDALIPKLQINPQDKILEIGYGHGLGIEKILSEYDCSMTGIDFSELMFKQACERNKKSIDSKKAELFYGDFLNFDVADNQFNKVFCINVVYFWKDLNPPFAKIYSSLKDGGMFCFYMVHSDFFKNKKMAVDTIFNKHSIDYVVECLKSAGFKDIDYNLQRAYIITCRK